MVLHWIANPSVASAASRFESGSLRQTSKVICYEACPLQQPTPAITVIELGHSLEQELERSGRVRIPIANAIPATVADPNEVSAESLLEHSWGEIYASRIRHPNGAELMFLYTDNEAVATMFRSAFLPAQDDERLRSYERGYNEGFRKACQIFGLEY